VELKVCQEQSAEIDLQIATIDTFGEITPILIQEAL
jgi:hypothetical protein